MSQPLRLNDAPGSATTTRTGRVLLFGAALGVLVGAVLTNLATALVELDESASLGAACEHAESTIAGAPSGLLVGLAAAAVYLLLRRQRRPVAIAVLGGAAGALATMLVVTFLLYPLATNQLPVFVCPY